MKLETIIKLIKNDSNIFGYCNSTKLLESIKNNLQENELRISIIKEPDCKISTKEIFTTILIPIIKAKNCTYRENEITLSAFSRSIFNLRIIDRACSLINSQMSNTYKFTIITNYDILDETHKEQEIT